MCAIFCWVELCINFKLERGRFNDPYFKQNYFISFFQRQMIRCFICIFIFLLKTILFQGNSKTFFLELIFFAVKHAISLLAQIKFIPDPCEVISVQITKVSNESMIYINSFARKVKCLSPKMRLSEVFSSCNA